MIYSSNADVVPFIKSLAQGLKPYAQSNDVQLSFSSNIKKQVVHYEPFLLSQSLIQLVCNIINLIPPQSKINLRLLYTPDHQNLQVEIENTGINLIRVNEICKQNVYSFTGHPLSHGTLYSLAIPLEYQVYTPIQLVQKNTSINDVPKFYKEFQKRLRSHFTQTDKLMATLEQRRPMEAAFMQKINALIKVNLEDENFDTNALCKAMSLSRTQLFRRMKSLIKQAPAHHIKNIRLQKAKELLETTDCTVSEIAFKTGFQTISHFTKILKNNMASFLLFFATQSRSATNE